MVAQVACPHCRLTTPEWRQDCIHCGFVRPTDGPSVLHVATAGRTGTTPSLVRADNELLGL